jgi:O-methyltransferase
MTPTVNTLQQTADVRTLYLDLLKSSLLNLIYPEADASIVMGVRPGEWVIKKVAEIFGVQLTKPLSDSDRQDGKDWPLFAHTMIGSKRLSNLQDCVESVLQHNVPGDLIETGVWRGGSCILMRGVLKAYGVTDRRVWVADSFEGLPRPSNDVDRRDIGRKLYQYKELAITADQVRANFSRYGLLDAQVEFLSGWFSQTLPRAPIEKLAVARLDGDMYESTRDAITALYPKLSVGGYLIVDDYAMIPACRQAIDEYRAAHEITEQMVAIDWTGVYWRRDH